jgi:hypothetical protein
MVSHRVVLRGSSGAEQTVRSTHRLECSEALLTSVIVQPLNQVRPVSGTAIGQGLFGVSLDFGDVIPYTAMYSAGTERQSGVRNRIEIDFNTDSRSAFYHPDLLFTGIVFDHEYPVRFMYPEIPGTPLTSQAMSGIESIILNFECNVSNLFLS